MEEKKDFLASELSDEQLDATSGGTQMEIDELVRLTGLDEDHLFDALQKVGINFMMLTSGQSTKNIYIDRDVEGGAVSHQEVVQRLNIYKLTHPSIGNPFK